VIGVHLDVDEMGIDTDGGVGLYRGGHGLGNATYVPSGPSEGKKPCGRENRHRIEAEASRQGDTG